MPIPALAIGALTGLSALAGLFGNRKKTIETTQRQQGYNQTNIDVTDRPEFYGQAGANNEALGGFIRNRLNFTPDLTGFVGEGLRSINEGANARTSSLNAFLAARGLGRSPMAAAAFQSPESMRIAEQVKLISQLPLMKRQFQTEDMAALQNWLQLNRATRRIGQTTEHVDMTTRGTQTDPGNRLGGLFSGIGSGLGMGLGMAYGSNNPQGVSWPSWLKKAKPVAPGGWGYGNE